MNPSTGAMRGRVKVSFYKIRVTVPPEPWTESVDDYEGRRKAAATWVNDHHNVDGLCKEMPQRMHDLVYVTRGGRLDR